LAAAQVEFEAAKQTAERVEDERLRALAAAKAEHAGKVAREHAKVAARNADIEARSTAFSAGH
jgi:hypothetical protein